VHNDGICTFSNSEERITMCIRNTLFVDSVDNNGGLQV